jgi:hypothetical protein
VYRCVASHPLLPLVAITHSPTHTTHRTSVPRCGDCAGQLKASTSVPHPRNTAGLCAVSPVRVLKDTTNPHFDLGGWRCGLEGLSSCGCARDMRCCVCSLATLLSAGGILAKSVRGLRLNEAAAQGSKPPFPGFVPSRLCGSNTPATACTRSSQSQRSDACNSGVSRCNKTLAMAGRATCHSWPGVWPHRLHGQAVPLVHDATTASQQDAFGSLHGCNRFDKLT